MPMISKEYRSWMDLMVDQIKPFRINEGPAPSELSEAYATPLAHIKVAGNELVVYAQWEIGDFVGLSAAKFGETVALIEVAVSSVSVSDLMNLSLFEMVKLAIPDWTQKYGVLLPADMDMLDHSNTADRHWF